MRGLRKCASSSISKAPRLSSERLPVAILAGGLATRLRPITERIPKALIEVAGRPFVEWQLEHLAGQGVRRAVMCIGYHGDQIEACVGTGKRFGLEVEYSPDGPRLLGTGGALRQALPLLGSEFFVLYGDSYLPVDYGAVQASYAASGKPALMTVLANADQWDKSNVEYREGVVVEYNKRAPRPQMRHIDYGLGILSAPVLEGPADEVFDLADVYHGLSVEGRLAGHEVTERFYEIGSHAGIADTEAYLAKRKG